MPLTALKNFPRIYNPLRIGTFRGLSALTRYEAEHQESLKDPNGYWGRISENVVWTKPWTKVLDDSRSPFAKWFVDGELSLVYNALDKHVDQGHGSQRALIWDSPITGNKKSFTFYELRNEVSKVSKLLRDRFSIQKDDRVIIYMPMIPETIIAMLAVARLGAVHSVVFGGFAANELSVRIRHLEPKLLVTASCGLEPNKVIEYKSIVDEALNRVGKPELPVLLYQRYGIYEAEMRSGRDFLWQDSLEGVSHGMVDCVSVESNHPLYIMYTSGTTGSPKGVQHPTGSHAVVNQWTMKAIYGINPGETWFAFSDVGWIVGHEYICYSPLLNRNATVLYEGKPIKTPDAGQIPRVISENGVKGLFIAVTGLRTLKLEDPEFKICSRYDMSSLKTIFVAGERCDESTKSWAAKQFGVPVLDHWWQTETGHAITAHCLGLGNTINPPPDSTGLPVPGFDVRILDDQGNELPSGEFGRIVCKLPLAPGVCSTLYKDNEGFERLYFSNFKGYYDTMDAGVKESNGYVKVLAREDDVINIAGHRISTARLEEALMIHPDVGDCAVIGAPDTLKGQVAVGIVVLKEEKSKEKEAIFKELKKIVRSEVGAVASISAITSVKSLPKTRSGKIARKSISQMAAGTQIKIPPTIEDISVYEEIRSKLTKILGVDIPHPLE